MPRPILLTVEIDAMRHNLSQIRRRLIDTGSSARIWAVAKAYGYGQGIEAAVSGFAQADGLAVLDLQEARSARASGWVKPILMLEGAFHAEDFSEMVALDCMTVIASPEHVQRFLDAPRAPRSVWVKLNTGMNRLGFAGTISDLDLVAMLKAVRNKTDGPLNWMTHFANSEIAGGCDAQSALFFRWQAQLARSIGDSGGQSSLANSAASLVQPSVYADWVRPGIALYGATPFANDRVKKSAASFGLKPVQTLSTEVIAIQSVKAGDCVGYGGRFKAMRDSRIGVLAVGYADGYPRSAPDGTPVWIASDQGKGIVPLAGQVSMDMVTVDLTDRPDVRVGSQAQLWGAQVDIDEIAHRAGTNGYELMTTVTTRVPRRVIDHG